MAAVPVWAYSFAGTFRLRELVPVFDSHAHVTVEKDRLLAEYGGGRYALAYDFGGVSFLGAEPAERERVVKEISGRLPPEPHAPLTEEYAVEVRPGQPGEVKFDRVIVPELTHDVLDIVGLVVAQSAAIDYYAEDVEQILARTERIAAELQSAGRIVSRLRPLVKFIGSCMSTRNAVISTLALFDKPDATWENESLDKLWNGLYHMLELDDRSRSLEAKLHMIQDNLVLLVDLSRGRQTTALELTVVVLILCEIAVMVWQILR
jgi:uncharacterized Rmd1/YagE family protein